MENLTNSVVVTEQTIRDTIAILEKYKAGKKKYNKQIIDDEQWYRLRHWRTLNAGETNPVSAWTFNSIANKHADMMDNVPTVSVLAREESDETVAKQLSDILPVVLQRNKFEQAYDEVSWSFLKHGLGAYGVTWDNTINGLGDVSIKAVDILNIYWEPGVTDIQDSANVFILSYVNKSILNSQYPQTIDKLKGNGTIDEYIAEESKDGSERSVVVDWYYKKNGVLHYCKFVEDIVLFASENEPGYENGFYAHGKYPIVLQTMYPFAGTCFGFGIISVCHDPQLYIDKLDGALLDNVLERSLARYLAKKNSGINSEDFFDRTKRIVWCEGDINDERFRQIMPEDISNAVNLAKQAKIEELKETSSNRDISQGSSGGGITSGAAIATLQEAGNKTSRDMIAKSYRAFEDVCGLVIELMRQFYTEDRYFRILGQDGLTPEYIAFNNSGIAPQETIMGGEIFTKEPIFDLDIKAYKKSPFSQTAQNETVMNMFQLGMFRPDAVDMTMCALDAMEFDGLDEIKRQLQKYQTMQDQIVQLAQYVQMLTGGAMGQPTQQGGPTPSSGSVRSSSPSAEAFNRAAENGNTAYTQKLVEKARPEVGQTSQGTKV